MEGEVRAEKSVPDCCILFAKSALWLASTGRKNQLEQVMSVIFDFNFDAGSFAGT